jgi:superfamily II DNA or RNA helicase
MALEGLIGPVIAEKKIQEVASLAKPIIKLKKIPFSQTIHDLRTWKDVYRLGVVYNSRRHRIVLEDAIEQVKQGKTALILVVEIQHGYNLIGMAKNRFPNLNIQFVWGRTPIEDRMEVKKLLNEKKMEVVIANAIWREGVDIPSLGAIINAAGGKSEIMTLQSLGRGLRTTTDKKDVVLVDYFDNSHHYLVSHFGERITLYFDEGWI